MSFDVRNQPFSRSSDLRREGKRYSEPLNVVITCRGWCSGSLSYSCSTSLPCFSRKSCSTNCSTRMSTPEFSKLVKNKISFTLPWVELTSLCGHSCSSLSDGYVDRLGGSEDEGNYKGGNTERLEVGLVVIVISHQLIGTVLQEIKNTTLGTSLQLTILMLRLLSRSSFDSHSAACISRVGWSRTEEIRLMITETNLWMMNSDWI